VCWEHNKVGFEAFLNAKTVSDRLSFKATVNPVEHHGVQLIIQRCINHKLESRNIITTLSGETPKKSTTRGYPQEHILWLLLWSLAADKSGDSAGLLTMLWDK
jgi:hypothetical protein